MIEGEAAADAPSAVAPPVIVLVEPQLGENIGMVARAMLNCGLHSLRLVSPREPWPNDKAVAAAAGADEVLRQARLFSSINDAIADLQWIGAATVRPRSMEKRVLDPRGAASHLAGLGRCAQRTGIVFGRESSGLSNDDVALADAVVTVPTNPGFGSLNLAMAVLIVAYEWLLAGTPPVPTGVSQSPAGGRAATKAEVAGLSGHLEDELDRCGFLRPQEKRPVMVRNLRNLLARAALTEQDVRTLRGVISCLVNGPRSRPSPPLRH
jgi:tRNA/rRNA methyltransferase